MKLLTVVGARPQFIKAAPVSRELRKVHREILVHTGQHYDYQMSEVFFKELDIPAPDYNLEVGSGSHGVQTGQMMIRLEEVVLKERPDCVLVYGDTNSTLAGALVASKLHIPVAHVEAGLRSFNKAMPEEINRVLTDHVSDLLFAPTDTATKNLAKEGITKGVHQVGDVMHDAVLYNFKIAEEKSDILKKLSLDPQKYLLATIHRASNTDDKDQLGAIIHGFSGIGEKIVFPLHPRTQGKIKELGLSESLRQAKNVHVIDPVGYLDMLILEKNARLILTDSGGVQKEAYFFKVPCITLREETEWVETVESGWNCLLQKYENLAVLVKQRNAPLEHPNLYGNGDSAEKILHKLLSV